jgi:hypothetical protein
MRLNWLAILVAAVVHWILGAVWFTAFSRQWQAGLRMSPEELQAYSSHPNYWPYIISFLCNVILAYAIARVLSIYDHTHLFRGLGVGTLVGLAAAVAMSTELVFELRSPQFIGISAGYPLVGCMLMGMIIGAWKSKDMVQAGSPVAS